MLPIYIKGFLPPQSTAIMLPADITTITGADFDIDKLFFMMPEFSITDGFTFKDYIRELKLNTKGDIYKNAKEYAKENSQDKI